MKKRLFAILTCVMMICSIALPVFAAGNEPLDWDNYLDNPDYSAKVTGWGIQSYTKDSSYYYIDYRDPYKGDNKVPGSEATDESKTLTLILYDDTGKIAEQMVTVDIPLPQSYINLMNRTPKYNIDPYQDGDVYYSMEGFKDDYYSYHGSYNHYDKQYSLDYDFDVSFHFDISLIPDGHANDILSPSVSGNYLGYEGTLEQTREMLEQESQYHNVVEETEIAGNPAFIIGDTGNSNGNNTYSEYRYYVFNRLPDVPGFFLCIDIYYTMNGPDDYQPYGGDDGSTNLHQIISAHRDIKETIEKEIIPDLSGINVTAVWGPGWTIEDGPQPSPQVVQRTIRDADKDPGEDEGVSVSTAIVVGVLGSSAAIAGAVVAAALTNGQLTNRKSYKMYVQKDFGDTLPRGGEPVIIRSRMAEVDENEKERDRNDLTAKIAVLGNGMTIHSVSVVGRYCEATVSIPKDYAENTASISFIYKGEGGTFTNEVVFNVEEPSIEFYQPNIALKARDEDGAEIGFTVKGLAPEKTKIGLKITGGSSYTAACSYAVTEDGKLYPGTYFAVIGDINEDEGEPGTYVIHTLHVTATDGTLTVTGEIDIYRVTVGLNIGINALNCYRVLKKEAAGKEVNDLTASDFDISYTKAPAMILEYDENKREMFYLPAKTEISFELIDPDDSVMRDRLEGLGLKSVLTDVKESMSEYTFYCTKGWLEPPLRVPVKLVAKATAIIGEEEKAYKCEKEVMLLSQRKRKLPLTSAQMDEDLKLNQWIPDAMSFITDNGLIDDLGGEYMLLGVLWDSFDENFGFDPILVAQIQSNINDCLFKRRRYALEQRQRYYEKVQETAYADDNYWTIWSKSFAMVSENYVDTWGGIATRIMLGFCTGGLSEIPFTAMDINKAVSDYNERTLLCDRTTGGKLFAGSVPVIICVVTAGVIKGTGWTVKVVTPGPVKAGLKNWAMRQSQAVMKKIPEKWIYASKKIYSKFNEYVQKINSYDPRRKMLNIRKAAAEADALNLSARAKAQKDVLNVRRGPLSAKGQFKSTVQRAAELRAAKKLDRFKKAADRVRTNPSPEAMKELRDAFFEVDKDTFALRMLNQEGKTEAQIVSKAKVKNVYRADYNECKMKFMEDPAEELMKKKGAAMKGVSEDKIVVKRATGKTAQDLKDGITSPFDSDNSPMYYDEKTGDYSYFTQSETEEIVGTSYCEATGISYTDVDDAVIKSSEIKSVAVTPDSPEAYMELPKMKTVEAFSDEAIEANMKTGKYKMGYEYGKMENAIDDILADDAKTSKILDDCARFTNREIADVSDESLKAINMLEKQAECLHQTPKTNDLYVGKDINGQAYGAASGFTEETRVFVETCRMAENQGTFNIDLGEMSDILEKRGTTYSKSVSDMVLDFKTINTNCRAANRSAASGFMNLSPGSGITGAELGTLGSVGSSLSNENKE